MKWFTTIWAFYLMTLSIIPCSDSYNRCNDAKLKVSVEQTHQHDQDRDDVCAPFCHCSCCSLSVILFHPHLSDGRQPIATFVNNKLFIHDFSFLSNYYGNIWQPPKINA